MGGGAILCTGVYPSAVSPSNPGLHIYAIPKYKILTTENRETENGRVRKQVPEHAEEAFPLP